MTAENTTTLERIHKAAKAEFMEKGYQKASLRNIVKSVGMTLALFTDIIRARKSCLKHWLESTIPIFSVGLLMHRYNLLSCLNSSSRNH